jgi:hypothetical protein
MELSTSRPSNSWGSRHKRGDTGSPGAGRAKLRLSRGFPRCLAHDVIPYGMGRPVDRAILGGHVTSGITRQAPVRAEPHPTSWCASAGREAVASCFNRPRSRYRSLSVAVQRGRRMRTSTIGRTEGGRLPLLRRHADTPIRRYAPPGRSLTLPLRVVSP